MKEYYDHEMTDSYNAVVRTCVVENGEVTDEFVWQKSGNVRGFDAQMYLGKTTEEIMDAGFKPRRG